MKSRLWASSGYTYHFPELTLQEFQLKAPIGVCFSGGGTRAMSAAMGQLRALHHMGYLSTFRYISCVSGGSWASTIYTYYRSGAVDDNQLLGPITAPGGITQNHLNYSLIPEMLAYNAQTWLVGVVANWEASPFVKYTSHDVWNYSIGDAYLKPFGLFDVDAASYHPENLAYFTLNDQTEQDIVNCNPGLQGHDFHKVRQNRPLLVINSSIQLPQSNPQNADLLNFEYTPLTVGRAYLSVSSYDQRLYGGGYVEPFAFRGYPPAALPDVNGCSQAKGCNNSASVEALGNTGWVDTDGQDRPFILADTTGTSSSAYAQELIDNFDISRYDPQLYYWAIRQGGYGPGAPQLFGDGGILENNGVIPLLQRGVDILLVFINTESKLDVNWVPNGNPLDVANDPNGYCDVTWPALFGYSNPAWTWNYPTNGVFKTSEFQAVLQAMQTKKKNGDALVTTYDHTVVHNPYWGVPARSEKVTVIWYYLERWLKWEANLHSAVRSAIQQGNGSSPSGPFEYFPNYLTINQNDFDVVALTAPQITLLADLACDIVMNDSGRTLQTVLEKHGKCSR